MDDETLLDQTSLPDALRVDDELYTVRGTGPGRDYKVTGDRLIPTVITQSTSTSIDLGIYFGDLVIIVPNTITSDITITLTNALPTGRTLTVMNNFFGSSAYKVTLNGSGLASWFVYELERYTFYSDGTNLKGLALEGIHGPIGIRGGRFAHREGDQNQANGDYAHAEGFGTFANGIYAHAEGTANTASNNACHAEGVSNQATGIASHAEGAGNIATATNSHAEGANNEANGVQSHVEGDSNIADGSRSHAEGNGTLADGDQSHAEGNAVQAIGTNSHAEGIDTITNGNNSHAEGDATTTNGNASHAEGVDSTAEGLASHAEGNDCEATSNYSHAQGDHSVARLVSMHAEANGVFANPGDAQHTRYMLRGSTTDNTLTELVTPARFTLDDEHAYACTVTVVGRRDDGSDHAMYKRMLVIERTGGTVALAGAVEIIGSDIETTVTYNVSLTADDTNKSLNVSVLGAIGHNVRWTAIIEALEIQYND